MQGGLSHAFCSARACYRIAKALSWTLCHPGNSRCGKRVTLSGSWYYNSVFLARVKDTKKPLLLCSVRFNAINIQMKI